MQWKLGQAVSLCERVGNLTAISRQQIVINHLKGRWSTLTNKDAMGVAEILSDHSLAAADVNILHGQ